MKKYSEGGIYTAEMGQPPMDPEGVPSAKKPAPKAPAPKTPPPKDSVFREGMPGLPSVARPVERCAKS